MVIEATSVNMFKNRLDRHWSDMGAYRLQLINYIVHHQQVLVQVTVDHVQCQMGPFRFLLDALI